jgi:AcrR family transcriptional regulator
MPRVVDPAERLTEIVDAAVRILARGGVGALTLRSLAEELNGSITLVTHFVANRTDLFEAIVDDLVATYDQQLEALDHGHDAAERLYTLLTWLLPLTPEDQEREAGRIALHAMKDQPSVEHFFEVVERRSRDLLTDRLTPLLPGEQVPAAVDHFRALLSGIIVSVLEHPDHWTPDRQIATMESAMALFGIRRTGL